MNTAKFGAVFNLDVLSATLGGSHNQKSQKMATKMPHNMKGDGHQNFPPPELECSKFSNDWPNLTPCEFNLIYSITKINFFTP